MRLTIRVPGKPVPKGRPRFARGRTYTPKTTRDHESRIAEIAAAAMQEAGVQMTGERVAVRITVAVQVPKSYRGEKRREALAQESVPAGDLDNHCKAILDGLNAVLWEDDRQVVILAASKRWVAEGQGLTIRVRTLPKCL